MFLKKILTGFFCLLIFSFCMSGWAFRPDNPAAFLEQAGLDTSPTMLAKYLETGFPEKYQGKTDPARNWGMYIRVVRVLGSSESDEAVSVLLKRITDPLPPGMEKDLQAYVKPVGNKHVKTEAETKERAEAELCSFRSDCALVLSTRGDKSILPALKQHMQDTHQKVLGKTEPDVSILRTFAIACQAVFQAGDRAGVETLIGYLDHLPRNNSPDCIIDPLSISTRQYGLGPTYTQPYQHWPVEIAKWKTWWEANKNRTPEDILKMEPFFWEDFRTPLPNSASPRQHLAAVAQKNIGMGGYSQSVQASENWLSQNGKKRLKEIVAVLNDKDEDWKVREIAMDCYARFGGKAPFKVIRAIALDDKQFSGTQHAAEYFQQNALHVLATYFPDRADAVLKACIASEQTGSTAATILEKNTKNLDFLIKNFSKIPQNARAGRLQYFLKQNAPQTAPVYYQAVQDRDVWVACYGWQGIQKYQLESKMPDAAKAALEKWQQDPEFQSILARLQ